MGFKSSFDNAYGNGIAVSLVWLRRTFKTHHFYFSIWQDVYSRETYFERMGFESALVIWNREQYGLSRLEEF